MRIGIVHISDIHLRAAGNVVAARVASITSAVRGVAQDISDVLLIVTGDIAYSGKQDEYAVAADFLSSLEGDLRALHVNFLGTALIPGNHDCEFGTSETVRSLFVDAISNPKTSNLVPPEYIDQVMGVHKNFFEFEALVSGLPAVREDRLCWVREFQASGVRIAVRCINTAWLSKLDQPAGQLVFPMEHAVGRTGDGDMAITIFHHPYNWLKPENAREFRKLVESTSDLVLTGHEHDGTTYTRINSASATNYVEGAALQASDVQTGFHFIELDLDVRTYQVHQFVWNGDIYSASVPSPVVFTRNQVLLEHRFVNNTEFKKTLQDLGAPFSHPIKAGVRLRDLFVYPDLRVIRLDSLPGKMEKLIKSQDARDYVLSKQKIIIGGSPTSGRSSLAKVLYEDFQAGKLVPVLLRGTDFKGVEPSQIVTAISRAFERQYSGNLLERFNQLPTESKVLIVDDWHHMKFSLKGKAKVTETLSKLFDRLVLISDDVSILRQVGEIEELSGFADYEHCEIKEFGHSRRGELVTRWHLLGREMEIDDMELTRSVAASEHVLNTLIEKGALPAFPFYVLWVLQENARAADRTASYGSYGHIYEALLTTRMAIINKKGLNQKYTYLSIIAHRMFALGKTTLNSEDLKQVAREYWESYMFSLSQDTFLEEMEKAQILSRTGDGVSFQHRFAYYFCVAKYFDEGVSNPADADSVRARLRTMADTAYESENSRILIFYLYLRKDRELIEYILANAARMFANYGPCDLKQDVAFVNALYSARPKVAVALSDPKKNREEFRRNQDELHEANNPSAHERTDESLRIDLAMESLQIMGQVLRNFPGNLRGDMKLKLARESYQLGLRAMSSFLKETESNLGKLRDSLLAHLREHESSTRRDIAEAKHLADKLIIAISELVIFALLKRISSSIGLEELRDVYQALRAEAGEDNIPIRLIDLAVALDHFSELPVEDVRDLEHRVRDNTVVHTVLKFLVGQYLALFPVKYKVSQSMVQLFGFQQRVLLAQEKAIKQLASGQN